MGLTDPYRLQNYMGEYASETGTDSVLEFIQDNRWDSDGDGTGDPQEGMMFYNTSSDVMAVYVNSNWIAMNSLWERSGTVLSPLTSSDTIQVGAGSVTTPGFAFSSDPNTGAFRGVDDNAADMFGVSTGGASRFEVSVSYLKSNVAYRGIEGSAATPSMTFYDNPDSGIFSDVGNNKYFAVTSNGTQTLAISSTRAWDVDAAAFDVDGTTLSFDGTASSNFSIVGTSDVDLTISSTSATGNANVLVVANTEIDLSSTTVDVNATGAFTVDGGDDSHVSVDGGDLTVSTTTSGDLNVVAAYDVGIQSRSGTGLWGNVSASLHGIYLTASESFASNTMTIYGVVTNSGSSGDATVWWESSATDGGDSLATLKAAVGGGGNAYADVTSDQYMRLVYGDGAAGVGTLTVALDSTNLATFAANGAVTFNPASTRDFSVDTAGAGGDIKLTTDAGGVAQQANIELLAQGDLSDITFDAARSIEFNYERLGGSGSFKISEGASGSENLILDIGSTGGVAWTPASDQNYNITLTGTSADYTVAAAGGTVLISNTTGDIDLKTTSTGDMHLIVGNNQRLGISDLGHWDMDGNTFVLDATGNITFSGDVGYYLTTDGEQQYRADTQFVWYQDGTATANRRMYFNSVGAMTFTPAQSEDFTVEVKDSATIDLKSEDGIIANTCEEFRINDGIVSFPGSLAGTSHFDAWLATKYASASNQYIVHLGPGVHQITSFSTTQDIVASLHIVGGRGVVLEFQDADSALRFSEGVTIENVEFTKATNLTGTDKVIGFESGASGSVLVGCKFSSMNPSSGASPTIISLSSVDDCHIERCEFDGDYPSGTSSSSLIDCRTVNRIVVRGCKGGLTTRMDCDWFIDGSSIDTSIFDGNYMQSSATTGGCGIYLASDSGSNFVCNNLLYAGDGTGSGHTLPVLEVLGGSNQVYHNYFEWRSNAYNSSAESPITFSSNYGIFDGNKVTGYYIGYTSSGTTFPTASECVLAVDASRVQIMNNTFHNVSCKSIIRIGTTATRCQFIGNSFSGAEIPSDANYAWLFAVDGGGSDDPWNNVILGSVFQAYTSGGVGTIALGSDTTTASQQPRGWSVVGNTIQQGDAICLNTASFQRSAFIGNSTNVDAFQASTSGTGTNNQFGTSNATESSGANG